LIVDVGVVDVIVVNVAGMVITVLSGETPDAYHLPGWHPGDYT